MGLGAWSCQWGAAGEVVELSLRDALLSYFVYCTPICLKQTNNKKIRNTAAPGGPAVLVDSLFYRRFSFEHALETRETQSLAPFRPLITGPGPRRRSPWDRCAAGLPTVAHGMKRRVEELRGHHCGVDGNHQWLCGIGDLLGRNAELSAAARSGIAAKVVSSRAASRPYSRITTKHESVHDRATAQRTPSSRRRDGCLRNVISSNEGTGAQRIGEFGAPSLTRSPG